MTLPASRESALHHVDCPNGEEVLLGPFDRSLHISTQVRMVGEGVDGYTRYMVVEGSDDQESWEELNNAPSSADQTSHYSEILINARWRFYQIRVVNNAEDGPTLFHVGTLGYTNGGRKVPTPENPNARRERETGTALTRILNQQSFGQVLVDSWNYHYFPYSFAADEMNLHVFTSLEYQRDGLNSYNAEPGAILSTQAYCDEGSHWIDVEQSIYSNWSTPEEGPPVIEGFLNGGSFGGGIHPYCTEWRIRLRSGYGSHEFPPGSDETDTYTFATTATMYGIKELTAPRYFETRSINEFGLGGAGTLFDHEDDVAFPDAGYDFQNITDPVNPSGEAPKDTSPEDPGGGSSIPGRSHENPVRPLKAFAKQRTDFEVYFGAAEFAGKAVNLVMDGVTRSYTGVVDPVYGFATITVPEGILEQGEAAVSGIEMDSMYRTNEATVTVAPEPDPVPGDEDYDYANQSADIVPAQTLFGRDVLVSVLVAADGLYDGRPAYVSYDGIRRDWAGTWHHGCFVFTIPGTELPEGGHTVTVTVDVDGTQSHTTDQAVIVSRTANQLS